MPVLLRIVFHVVTSVSSFTFHNKKLQCTLPHKRLSVQLCCFRFRKRINRYRNDRTVRAEHTHEQRRFHTDCQIIDRFLPCSNSCRQFSPSADCLSRAALLPVRSAKRMVNPFRSYSSHSPSPSRSNLRALARLTVQIHLTKPKRGILIFLPCAAIPIYNDEYALGWHLWPEKLYSITSASLWSAVVSSSPVQGDCVVCRRLSAPAQNPHKSQCQSCRVPFFHVVHLLLLLLCLQCSRFG